MAETCPETENGPLQPQDGLKVHIACYRGVQEAYYEFPPSGIVKITGPNGSGKSTILSAISWCLYGTPTETANFTKKAADRGRTKVVVEVPPTLTSTGNWLIVTRQSCPHTLDVQVLAVRSPSASPGRGPVTKFLQKQRDARLPPAPSRQTKKSSTWRSARKACGRDFPTSPTANANTSSP